MNNQTTADKVLEWLEENEKEPKRQKNNGKHREVYRCISPLREDAENANNFELRIDDDEHGGYSDFPADEHGSLYELAKKLGIETNGHTSKRAYKDADDYAESHGITLTDLKRCGWYETEKDNRPALAIPLDDGSIKYRYLDGAKPPFKNPTGSHAQWYKLDSAIRISEINNIPLIVTNGETSVASAQNVGLPAVSTTAGEKALSGDLLAELKQKYSGEIFIARDNDDTGRSSALALKEQLINEGYNVRALDLGNWTGYDLADFVKTYQSESLRRIKTLPDIAEEVTSDFFLTIDDILGMSKPEWLIENYLLEKRNTIIWGDSETFKTLYLLNKACHLAENAIVIWIAGEDLSQFKPYLDAWIAHYQKKPRYLFIWDGAVNLLDATDVNNFITRAKTQARKMNKEIALAVFDTLRVCLVDGDENSSRDISMGLQNVAKIRKALNTTTATIHHATKNGENFRGSAAIRNNADAMIHHSRNGSGDIVLISFDKLRGEKPKTQHVRMHNVGMSVIVAPVSEFAEETLSRQARQDNNITTKHEVILMTLAKNRGFSSKGLQRENLTEATGIPKSSIIRYLNDLQAEGLIEKDGYFYRITEKGRSLVE